MQTSATVDIPAATPDAAASRPFFGTILHDVWNSRELLSQLVRRDLRLRYRQAVMGFAWALLLPVLTIAAGLVVRGAMSSAGGQGLSLGGITIKSWAWAFFAGAMNFGTVSVLGNVQLVTKIYFPREVLPIASIITQAADSLISLALLLILAPWLGFHWSLQLLWVPVLLVLLLILTTGLAFLFACANLFFRDVKYILQVLLTFGVFFTPVFFTAALYPARFRTLMMLNPLSPILEGLRLTIVDHTSLLHVIRDAGGHIVWAPSFLCLSAAVSLILFFGSLVVFRRSAAMFAEYY